jgi:hypothetical protein
MNIINFHFLQEILSIIKKSFFLKFDSAGCLFHPKTLKFIFYYILNIHFILYILF